MIYRAELSKRAQKQLKKLPQFIIENLTKWVDDLETRSLEEVRKVPGYHDEPLQGHRWGQRSIRLSRTYRAIYSVKSINNIKYILIEEVAKHEY